MNNEVKLTPTQLKALTQINSSSIENWTTQKPFQRGSQNYYLNTESLNDVYSKKTYDKLVELELIQIDKAYQTGFGTYKSKVSITDLGKQYLENQ